MAGKRVDVKDIATVALMVEGLVSLKAVKKAVQWDLQLENQRVAVMAWTWVAYLAAMTVAMRE